MRLEETWSSVVAIRTMEEDMLMTGALAEILLLVRPLVDDAVASLEEDEPVRSWVAMWCR